MRRRVWIPALVVLVLLPVADTILWQIAVDRLRDGFDAWAAASKASDLTVTRGKAVSGGWPFAATVRIDQVSVSGGESWAPGGATWLAPSVILRLSPRHPRSLDIAVTGEQRLRAGPNFDAVLTGTRLLVVASMGLGDQPGALDILADQARLVTAQMGTASAERLRFHLDMPDPAGGAGRKFAFSVESVALPDPVRWPLGSSLARLDFDGSIDGQLLPARSLADAATAWRDGGGSILVQNLTLNWGPLSVTGSATLALDDQLQPMGAGTSRVSGYGPTLDALARDGVLNRSAAKAAKGLLALLSGQSGDGDNDEVEVPLTLQYRTLSVRQVPLLLLPEVDWR